MNEYVICIDASVDIEQQYIEDKGVIIIPMEYVLGSDELIMKNSKGTIFSTFLCPAD